MVSGLCFCDIYMLFSCYGPPLAWASIRTGTASELESSFLDHLYTTELHWLCDTSNLAWKCDGLGGCRTKCFERSSSLGWNGEKEKEKAKERENGELLYPSLWKLHKRRDLVWVIGSLEDTSEDWHHLLDRDFVPWPLRLPHLPLFYLTSLLYLQPLQLPILNPTAPLCTNWQYHFYYSWPLLSLNHLFYPFSKTDKSLFCAYQPFNSHISLQSWNLWYITTSTLSHHCFANWSLTTCTNCHFAPPFTLTPTFETYLVRIWMELGQRFILSPWSVFSSCAIAPSNTGSLTRLKKLCQ
jgi:hypothetical protein